jgi:hypothetical protein
MQNIVSITSFLLILSTSGYVVANAGDFDIRLSVLISIGYLIFIIISRPIRISKKLYMPLILYSVLMILFGLPFGLYLNFFKSIAQILLVLIVMLALDQQIKRIGIINCFNIYLKLTYIVCIIGILQFIIHYLSGSNINTWGPFPGYLINERTVRISSIFMEPSSFGFFCYLAIAYIVLDYKNSIGLKLYQKFVILIAYLLSGSAVGYAYLIIIIIIGTIMRKSYAYIIYGTAITSALLILSLFSEELTIRFVEVYSILGIAALPSINIQYGSSTLALYNNMTVAISSFLSNPFIGSGIGNHSLAYDRFISNSLLPDIGLNKGDANSMYLRIISEMGGFGVIIIFYAIYKNFIKIKANSLDHKFFIFLNRISLFAILGYMIRFGSYYDSLFVFYMMLYYHSNRASKYFGTSKLISS